MNVNALVRALRASALRHPGAEEGVACEGTPLEKRTVKVGKKAFAFLGLADVMVKLDASQAEAGKLASKQPGRYKVGAHGWVTVRLSAGDDSLMPAQELLDRWIEESYGLMAGPPPKRKIAVATSKSPKKPGTRAAGRK